MDHVAVPNKRKKLSRRKVLGFASLSLGAVVLVCVVVILSFPGIFLQEFVEGQITRAFAESNQGYSIRTSGFRLDILRNRIACDSVTLARNDSSVSCSIATLSVGGIHWLGLLRGTSFDMRGLAGSIVEAGGFDLTLQPSGYRYRCGPLRVSVPDSEIVAEAVDIHPSVNGEQFFGGSRFRKTRIGLGARKCTMAGLALIDLLQGKKLHARSVQFQDVSADILINKDKPSIADSPAPRMPSEILASIKDTVGLDSLIINDGQLRYGERMTMGMRPATLTFDHVQVLVTGIASHSTGDANVGVQARGNFAGGGTLKLAMSIPLSRQHCSFRYSGSLSRTDISVFNSFVEISDAMRIKTGLLETAAFDIDVNAGSATGNVRAVYRDLIIASINGRTGSETGVFDRFSSWIAKNMKIRGTNMPDKLGAMKIGIVSYVRKKDDPFMGFVWFALRSGVGDIVGF